MRSALSFERIHKSQKSDTVILSLCDDTAPPEGAPDDFKEINWGMEFNNVKAFRFDCYAVKSDDVEGEIWDYRPDMFRIGMIYSSELGITDDNDYYFKFITEWGHAVEIVFQKVKLTKSYCE